MNYRKITKKVLLRIAAALFIITIGFGAYIFQARAANTLQPPINVLGLQNGLISWYTFDGKDMQSNNIADRSGSGNNGTPQGFSSIFKSARIGKLGQALYFNGDSSQYVSIAAPSTGTGSFTVSAWVKPNDLSNKSFNQGAGIISNMNTESVGDFYLAINSTHGPYFYNNRTGGNDATGLNYIDSALVPKGVWTLVTAVWNGSSNKIYINGVDQGALTTGTIGTGWGAVHTLGQISGLNGYTYGGMMDDVRVYNRALSAAEINQLYEVSSPSRQNVSIAGPANFLNGLAGWWTFDGRDTVSGLVVDRSGNTGNGVIVNMSTSTAYAPGKIGQAFSFRDNQYIDAQNGSSLNLSTSGTVAFWARTTSAANDPVVCKQDFVQRRNGYCADLFAGKYKLTIADGSNSLDITSDQTWNDGSWHEVVSTWDSSSLKLYVDGVSAATAVSNAAQTGFVAYQGTITKPATTGTQQITGVGFKPKAIIFLSNASTADGTIATAELALGVVASTSDTTAGTQGSGVTMDNASFWHRFRSETSAIMLSDTSANLAGEAQVVSMDTDGFTLNWSTANASQYLVSYIAIGGTDITDAKVISFTSPTAVGDQANTNIGFQGDFMMLFSTSQVAAAPTSATNHAMSWGYATRAATTTQFGVGQAELGGAPGHIQMGRIHESVNTSAATLEEGSLKSFDANGFTMEWAKVSGTARYLTALVIKGGNYSTGVFNQNTSTGNQSVTGLGYKPVGLIMNSQNEVTGTAVTSGLRGGMGMTTGTSNRATVWSGSTAASSYSGNYDRTALMKVLTNAGNGSVTVNTVMDFFSFDSSGFTVNNTTVDATSREMAYAAFGPSSAPSGGAISPVSNVWNLNFGRNSDSGTKSYYSGLLDDVRIYNRALTATEVTNLYKLGSATRQNTSLVGADNLKSGLLGWYTFDGKDMPSGSVLDRSGNGYNGAATLMSTSTMYVPGRMGQALQFSDLATAGVKIGIPTQTAYTYSAWVNHNDAGTYSPFVANQSTVTFGVIGSGANAGKLDYFYSAADHLSSGTISPNTWQHVAVTVSASGGVTFYINGVASGTATGGPSSGVINYIGYDLGSGLKGKLDDVRIYNRVLSAAEVLQLYNLGR